MPASDRLVYADVDARLRQVLGATKYKQLVNRLKGAVDAMNTVQRVAPEVFDKPVLTPEAHATLREFVDALRSPPSAAIEPRQRPSRTKPRLRLVAGRRS